MLVNSLKYSILRQKFLTQFNRLVDFSENFTNAMKVVVYGTFFNFRMLLPFKKQLLDITFFIIISTKVLISYKQRIIIYFI